MINPGVKKALIKQILLLTVFAFFSHKNKTSAQTIDSKLGGWYIHAWSNKIKNSSWGFQGDNQLIDWGVIRDVGQLLFRGGPTYSPKDSKIKFTLGYTYVFVGVEGEGKFTNHENRIYQEMLLSHKIESRFFLRHRFRYEQRFISNQNYRTRYNYTISLSVPINKKNIEKGTVYTVLYEDIFINGQKDIGNNREVTAFDHNRAYLGLGYKFLPKLGGQVGYVLITTGNKRNKGYLQVSLHQKI